MLSEVLKPPVRILVVLGNSKNLKLEKDLALLEKLKKKGAEIEPLLKPSKAEFIKYLKQQAWDIIYFAGHSYTDRERLNNPGVIQLNDTESLSLNLLKGTLEAAVRNGLKLAIFNSCDGLGLAQNLAEVNIPHAIVMREPVPDEVAQHFLEHFLDKFSQGHSLNLSVRYARTQLYELYEDETGFYTNPAEALPCASWLPAIYENPTVPPLIWKQSWLSRLIGVIVSIRPPLKRSLAMIAIFIVTIIIAIKVKDLFYIQPQPQPIPNNHTVEPIITPKTNDHNDPINDLMSLGEKALWPNPTQNKKTGIEKFRNRDYQGAIADFQNSRKDYPNDPETLIYLNNAQAQTKNPLKIAVAVPIVPIGSNLEIAHDQEMLRGVAMAQNEINKNGGINGRWLQVEIVNDKNNKTIAAEVAQKLGTDNADRQEILAVIGHYASEITQEAVPVYQNNGLVLISPGSTSEQLTGRGNIPNHVFFRIPSSDSVYAKSLADYLFKQVNQQKVAVFYNPNSVFSLSLQKEFHKAFNPSGGQLVNEVDLSDGSFNASAAISKAQKQGATAIVLIPDGGTSINALNNALSVIKANSSLVLVGADTLYGEEILKLREQANHLVLAIPWHRLSSKNPDFTNKANTLWGTPNVNWLTATSYDAAVILIEALSKQPSRQGVQQVLADSNFKATGATGTISFQGSDRREDVITLVKVVQSSCSKKYGYKFVPLSYSTDPDCDKK